MFTPVYRNKFKADYKKALKQGKDLDELDKIFEMLLAGKQLPPKNRNHKLHGNYKGCWECHIAPDWLLIYEKTESEIIFFRTGSHSELFGK